MLQAKALWDSGQIARAAAIYDGIAEKDSGDPLGPEALYLSASLHAFYLNAPAAGAERFSRLISLHAGFSKTDQARLHLGALYLGPLQKPAAAVAVYRDLTDHGASDALREEGEYRLGQAYAALGKPDLARQEWRTLLGRYHDGRWVEKARLEIAASLDREQKTIEALNAYQNFVTDYPDSPYKADAHISIADCLERLDRPQEALALLKMIRKDAPNPDVIEVRIGRLEKRLRVLALIKR